MNGPRVVAAGDAVLIAEFDERIDPAVNARAVALAGALVAAAVPGVLDVVPTFRSVAVYFDPLRTDVAALASRLGHSVGPTNEASARTSRSVEIPVCYDEEFGPDLDTVAHFGGLDRDGVIAAHAGREYRVFMVGFLPGFAYLGTVEDAIAVPRRATPRRRVAAGSVGIAGQQTGIYPMESPGGWNLVGRTPVPMISYERQDSALLNAGDQVRFRRVDRTEFNRLESLGKTR